MRAGVWLAITAAAVALVACGGSSTDPEASSQAEYERAFNSIGDRSGVTETSTEDAIRRARTTSEIVNAFQNYSDSARRAGEAYDELDAPEDVAEQHEGFAAFVLRAADFYAELAEGIRDGSIPVSEAAIENEINGFLAAEENQTAMREFASALSDRGYSVTTPFT